MWRSWQRSLCEESEQESLRLSGRLAGAILDTVHTGKKMLCNDHTRKGSAPRNVGSKMLILEDGSCVGTIGGGCMEAEVLRKARVMMHENNTELKTEYVDMSRR